jgi:hypothetical protein
LRARYPWLMPGKEGYASRTANHFDLNWFLLLTETDRIARNEVARKNSGDHGE